MIRPINDLILIEPIYERESSIIETPFTKEEFPAMGKVLAVGPRVKSIKEDDIIIFDRYSCDLVKDRQQELALVPYDSVKCIVSE